MPASVLYRIEHWQSSTTTVMGVITDEKPHPRTLDPFLSRLLLDQRSGSVVLVNEATGGIVARRQVTRPTRS